MTSMISLRLYASNAIAKCGRSGIGSGARNDSVIYFVRENREKNSKPSVSFECGERWSRNWNTDRKYKYINAAFVLWSIGIQTGGIWTLTLFAVVSCTHWWSSLAWPASLFDSIFSNVVWDRSTSIVIVIDRSSDGVSFTDWSSLDSGFQMSARKSLSNS